MFRMKNKKETQLGFTLIELLVVIAIISILSGALLLAINPRSMVEKSRDGKRLTDIDTLVKAINLSLADGEITLVETTTGCGDDGCDETEGGVVIDGTGYVKFTIPAERTGLARFIPTLPADPYGDYKYVYASNGTNFEINAVLEHEDHLGKMTADGGNNANVYEVGTSLTLIP